MSTVQRQTGALLVLVFLLSPVVLGGLQEEIALHGELAGYYEQGVTERMLVIAECEQRVQAALRELQNAERATEGRIAARIRKFEGIRARHLGEVVRDRRSVVNERRARAGKLEQVGNGAAATGELNLVLDQQQWLAEHWTAEADARYTDGKMAGAARIYETAAAAWNDVAATCTQLGSAEEKLGDYDARALRHTAVEDALDRRRRCYEYALEGYAVAVDQHRAELTREISLEDPGVGQPWRKLADARRNYERVAAMLAKLDSAARS